MRKWVCASVLALTISHSVLAAEATGITVHDGYIRLPPPGSPAAAYFTLKNSGADRALVDADCRCAGMTMIHESIEQDGMAKMRHVDSAALPSGGELVLKPGGLHVMLMRLNAPLKAGDSHPLTLRFADGDTLTVRLPVQAR
ncbi:MAG TPA: copper chaperone PCu(A)C [Permianibacter sp.]|nr:copper chaperone PCu(A)C [Permianibacter sp.]